MSEVANKVKTIVAEHLEGVMHLGSVLRRV